MEDASDPNNAKVRRELMGFSPWITFCKYAAKFSIIFCLVGLKKD